MRILHRGGKLLSVAMLAASLGAGLLNGGFVEAAGTPFNATVNPNPVILQNPGDGTVAANFNVLVRGTDSGTGVTFTDTVAGVTGCTETFNGGTAVTTDLNGQAQVPVTLSCTSASTPGTYTITATGTVNKVAKPTTATYTLEILS